MERYQILIYCLAVLILFACEEEKDEVKGIDFNKKNLITLTYDEDNTSDWLPENKSELKYDNYIYGSYDSKNADKLTYDFYAPRKDYDSIPLVIYVHSGGFIGGSKENNVASNYSRDLSRLGIAVASINYRYLSLPNWEDSDSSWSNGLFKYNIPVKRRLFRAHQDVNAAVRYFHDNAEKFNIDPNNIFLAGYSIGGVLIQNLLYMSDNEAKEYYGRAYEECLSCLPYHNGASNSQELLDFVKGYISLSGGVFDINHIGDEKESDKPLLMFHSINDSIIDIGKSKPFQKYNKEYNYSINVPELFLDLGIMGREELNSLDEYKLGGASVGIKIPKIIMQYFLKIMTPDIYGSRIIYDYKYDKCTLVEIQDAPHAFMTDSQGLPSNTYYKTLEMMINYIKYFSNTDENNKKY